MEPREFHWPISRLYSWVAQTIEPGYRDLARRMALSESAKILLEVGGGNGRFAVTLSQLYPSLSKIVTTDISQDMVNLAKKRIALNNLTGKIIAEVKDAQKLNYPDNSFDVVVSTFSLHHWSEPVKALSEFQRIVKPGGLMTVFDGRNEVSFGEIKTAVEKIGGSLWMALALWLGKMDALSYEAIVDIVHKANIEWLSVSHDGPLVIISGVKN